jgi:hypothetical protein
MVDASLGPRIGCHGAGGCPSSTTNPASAN